jgi:tRNA-dihydrouridine synthase B
MYKKQLSKTLQFGNALLTSPALLSPLESVSDVGFRHVCGLLGAGITWTEMIRAQAICRNNKSALDLIDTYDSKTLTGLQLMVKTPGDLEKALDTIERLSATDERCHFKNISAVDLNFGCPSPAIIKEGAGPALLKRRKRLREIFDVLSTWRRSTTLSIGAVGCKIRLGLNQSEVDDKVYLAVADAAMGSGLDYLVVHARHAGQRSSDPPSPWAIREVKNHCVSNGYENFKIIGNGNIFSSSDAILLMQSTGCDGVMIARGAIRNPWIFRNIRTQLDSFSSSATGVPPEIEKQLIDDPPSIDEIKLAIESYKKWTSALEFKQKFIDFHDRNFHRILRNVQEGNEVIQFQYPRNVHIGK